MEMGKTHWRKTDYRIESLKSTIKGLDDAIRELRQQIKEIHWYNGDWFLEEAEPIIGLGFVAFQNYITGSIHDRFKTEKPYNYYKNADIINDSGRTIIEIIIGLANYFKHRDEPGELKPRTADILRDFDFTTDKDADLDNSPILKGLELSSDKFELYMLIDTVKKWREDLWALEGE